MIHRIPLRIDFVPALNPLTVAQAAERLGVSQDEIRRRLHRGELKGRKGERTWLVESPTMTPTMVVTEEQLSRPVLLSWEEQPSQSSFIADSLPAPSWSSGGSRVRGLQLFEPLCTSQLHNFLVRRSEEVGVEGFRKLSYWLFRNELWETNEDLDADAAHGKIALNLDREERQVRRAERAIQRLQGSSPATSGNRLPITDDVKEFVWRRDEGKCVRCGSNQGLEFDHIIPLAKGGSNTMRNLQLLCEACNRSKGANLS